MTPMDGSRNAPAHIDLDVRRPKAGPSARRSIAAFSAVIRLRVDGGSVNVRTPNPPGLICTVRDTLTGGRPAPATVTETAWAPGATFGSVPIHALRAPSASAYTRSSTPSKRTVTGTFPVDDAPGVTTNT